MNIISRLDRSLLRKFYGILFVAIIAWGSAGASNDDCIPNAKELSGGGILCDDYVVITLSSPDLEVAYQLKKNGSPFGTAEYANSFQDPIHWNITEAGEYTLRAKREECGIWYDIQGSAVVVSAAPATGNLDIDLSTDPVLVCPATGITLTASGGTGPYTWTFIPAPGGDSPANPLNGPTIQAAWAGEYTPHSSDACGNPMSASGVYVTFREQVQKPSLPSGIVGRCKGSGTSSYTSSSAYSDHMTWSVTGTGNQISNSGVVTWSPDFVGTAYVKAIGHGCGGPIDSDLRSVTVGTIRVGQLDGGSATTCPGDNVDITFTLPNNNEINVLYTLYRTHNGTTTVEDGTYMSVGGNPVQTWTFHESQPGTYTVKATGNNCTDVPMTGSYVINSTQTVSSLDLDFSTDPNDVCPATGITITASGGSGPYTWSFSPASPEGSPPSPPGGASLFLSDPESEGLYYAISSNACGDPIYSTSFHVTFREQLQKPSLPSGIVGRCKGDGTSAYTSSSAYSDYLTWSVTGTGNEISSGGVVTWSPDFVGTAYVKATAHGCGGPIDSNLRSVTVGTVPVGQLNGGNATTCPGVDVDLDFTLPDNTFTDVLYTLYRTHNGTTTAEDVTDMRVGDEPVSTWTFHESQAGTYTVKATGHNCTNVPMLGSSVINATQTSSSIEVDVDGDPSQVCLNSGSVTLTALNGANVAWWLKPTGETFTTAAILPPNISGYYHATGQNECGDEISSDPIEVRVYNVSTAAVTPAGPVKIKTTQQQRLTATAGEGYTYKWLKDGEYIEEETGHTIDVNEAAQYQAEISQSTYCPKLSNAVTITVNQLPVSVGGSDKTVTKPANSVSITGSGSDADGTISQYAWIKTSGNPVTLSGEQTQTLNISGLELGTYQFRLTVTDDMGETGSDDVTVVVVLPTNNYNWVKETTVLNENILTINSLNSAEITDGDKSIAWNYFDGIGRPLQQISVQGSPAGHDVVLPKKYDELGREYVNYLPYVDGNNGQYKTDALNGAGIAGKLFDFYSTGESIANDPSPMAKTVFEASPLNRVAEQGAPGAVWQPGTGHTIKNKYLFNATDEVLNFVYDPDTHEVSLAASPPDPDAYYEKNTLTCARTIDEHQNDVLEYANKEGQTVCKKVKAGTGLFASTYYLYDDLGRLAVVLSPEAVERLKMIYGIIETNLPVILPIANTIVYEGKVSKVYVNARSNYGEENLTWSFTNLPSFATTETDDGQAILKLAPRLTDNGTYSIKATVTDAQSNSVEETFVITVADVDVNSRKILVNISNGSNGPAPWNNMTESTIVNLKNTAGESTTVNVTINTPTWSVMSEGAVTGNDSGIFPDAVLRDALYFGISGLPDTLVMKITGLDTSISYALGFCASSTWTGVEDNGTTFYKIRNHSIAAGAQGNQHGVSVFNSESPDPDGSITVTMLKSSSTEVGYLNAFTITPIEPGVPAPAAPRNVAAVSKDRTILISWTDAAYNEDGFEIHRASNLGGPFSKINDEILAANTTSYVDKSVVAGATYYYKVKAIKDYGVYFNSSEAIPGTTAELPPLLEYYGDLTVSVTNFGIASFIAASGEIEIENIADLSPFAFESPVNESAIDLVIIPDVGNEGIYPVKVKATNAYGTVRETYWLKVVDLPRKTRINFSNSYSSPGWNNLAKSPAVHDKFENLKNEDGDNTGINLELLTPFGGVFDGGATTGNDSGIVPDNVLKEYYWFGVFGAPDEVKMKVSGLEPWATYYVQFIASSVFRGNGITDNGSTVYTINGNSQSLDVEGNTSTLLEHGGNADENGEMEITLSKAPGAPAGYINGMTIMSYNTVPAPFNFNASTSNGLVNLSWEGIDEDATGYEIYHKDISEKGVYTLVTTTAGDEFSFIDQDAIPGHTYVYRIRAKRNQKVSGYTPEKEITVPVAMSVPVSVGRTIMVNFNKDVAGPSSAWNNTLKDPVVPSTFTNLKDNSNKTTGVGVELLDVWGGYFNQGAVTGNNSGVVPDNVLQEYYWFGFLGAPEQEQIRIVGLTPGNAYNVKFLGSSVFRGGGVTDNGHTKYTICDQTISLDVEGNTTNFATFSGVVANDNGEIVATITKDTDATAGYLNALVVEMSTDEVVPPSSLSVSSNGNSNVTLKWTDENSNESGYEIYRSDIFRNESYTLLATTGANATTYDDVTVDNITTYGYKIRAIGSGNPSQFTAPVVTETRNVRRVYFNFGKDSTVPSPWNNASGDPVNGAVFDDLLDEHGQNTGFSIELASAWGGVHSAGASTGNNSGIVPDNALAEYYWFGIFGAPDTAQFKVRGLDPHLTYNLKFVGSSVFRLGGVTDNGSTNYMVGMEMKPLVVEGNTSNFAMVSNVNPDAEGNILVTLAKGTNAPAGYINAIIIDETILDSTVDPKDAIDDLAFQYRYDFRNRMTHKKVPGADWTYMVYDKRDRLVLSQTGEQRTSNKWTFAKYDVVNRPVMSGIYTHTSNIGYDEMTGLIDNVDLYDTFNADPDFHGYTNNVFPTTGLEVHVVTYYDDYTFSGLIGEEEDEFDFVPDHLDGQYEVSGSPFTRVNGQVTGTKTAILGESTYLWAVNYFDDKLRSIQSVAGNHRGGRDRSTSIFDFTGKPLKIRTTNEGEIVNTVTRTFEYSHTGVLLRTWHSIGDEDSLLLVENKYNEIGQLIDKNLHSLNGGGDFEQSIDYRYNVRGWLTSINDSEVIDAEEDASADLFGMNLLYNDQDEGLENTGLFNGNISAMKWRGYVVPANAYNFEYDPMNRLKSAQSMIRQVIWDPSGAFHEKDLTYDLNGNIMTLSRTGDGGSTIDNLKYSYSDGLKSGNRLFSVKDSGDASKGFVDGALTIDDYAYDKNGNMIIDRNKDIVSITYNHLNLPELILKESGEYIKYVYDASGRKLRQDVYDKLKTLKKRTDYVQEYFYENDTLKFINHEEGRIVMMGAEPEYQYHLKDHLGNVRITFTTKDEVEGSVANMETETAPFLYYDEAVKINSPIFDHTNSGPTQYSARLNGTSEERYGLAKSLSVMPGDTINASVFVKYLDPDTTLTPALQSFINAVHEGNAPGGTFKDGGFPGSTGGVLPLMALFTEEPENENEEIPRAYLNWLIFDRNYNLKDGGARQISSKAAEHGEDGAHEEISKQLVIQEAGYVYVYLSNDNVEINEEVREVYFDDFKVEHVKSPVIESSDYYPFGLTYNNYSRENSLANQYKFNQKEEQDELGLNWLDFDTRMYQPELGRMTSIDDHYYNYFSSSPYAFTLNNPILYSDPTGMDTVKAVMPPPIVPSPSPSPAPAPPPTTTTTPTPGPPPAVVMPAPVAMLFALLAITMSGDTYKFDHVRYVELQDKEDTNTISKDEREELEYMRSKKNNPYQNKTDAQLQKDKKSYEDLIQEHLEKIDQTKCDPESYFGDRLKGLTPEQRQQRIDGRINSLNRQLNRQMRELIQIKETIKKRENQK